MKKSVLRFTIFCLLFVSLFSNSLFAAGSKESSDGLKVVTTFYPMYDFAAKIALDNATISVLVPSGTEPHDWEPSSSDIIKLEAADIFIYNDESMEHWVSDVLPTIQNKDLVVVRASEGLTLLEHHEEEEHEHDHGSLDPHTWLSALNAIKEAENIKNGFIKVDEENKEKYEEAFTNFSEKLKALNADAESKLSLYRGKSIVVSHNAFSYLLSPYGIESEAIEGLEPDSEPTPKRMAEIESFVKEHKTRVIFSAEAMNTKVASAIATATGTKVEYLSPLEALTDEERENGDDYISIMKRNIDLIVDALK